MNTFIAFSGGVESTTLCLLFGAKARAIFADTGDEHQEMYERIDQVGSVLKKIYPSFEIIRVTAGEALHDYIRRKRIFPGPMMRFCTRIFKIEPINAFLSKESPCRLMIGLNAEETDRTGAYPMEGIEYEYPLQDLGLSRANCIELLKEYGLEPRLPVYMRRGGCEFCFYKSRKEYAAIAHLNPELAEKLADFEDSINRDRYGEDWAMVKEISEGFRAFFDNERTTSLFNAEEMYGFQSEVSETPCGVFCHR
jgi:hypothetical protein